MFRDRTIRSATVMLVALILSGCGGGGAPANTVPPIAADANGSERWIASWTASPQYPFPAGYTPNTVATTAFPANATTDQTFRMIVHVAVPGTALRVHFTNRFGAQALTIDDAAIARQRSGAAIDPATLAPLTVGGSRTWIIPAHADVTSDAASFVITSGSDVAVSFHIRDRPAALTWHATGLSTSYVTAPGVGDRSNDAGGVAFTFAMASWFFIDAIDSNTSAARETVVCLGDSITDGWGSAVDRNERWPDVLTRRLLAAGKQSAVVNAGIAGNLVSAHHIVTSMMAAPDGPSALERFDTDVLAQSGVSTVVLLEGINDIGGYGVAAQTVIEAQKQVAARAHAAGMRIFGATLTPSGGTAYGAYGTQAVEQARSTINAFIRSGPFDGVIDFDRAVRDGNDPTRLMPAFDSGDHLHPNAAGYAAMANAIDLHLFR